MTSTGVASLPLVANMPPLGGVCSLHHLLSTQYQINCRSWEDSDPPILYRVSYSYGSWVDIPLGEITMFGRHTVALPLMETEKHNVTLQVHVLDSYFSATTITFNSVEVNPQSTDYATAISLYYKEQMSGNLHKSLQYYALSVSILLVDKKRTVPISKYQLIFRAGAAIAQVSSLLVELKYILDNIPETGLSLHLVALQLSRLVNFADSMDFTFRNQALEIATDLASKGTQVFSDFSVGDPIKFGNAVAETLNQLLKHNDLMVTDKTKALRALLNFVTSVHLCGQEGITISASTFALHATKGVSHTQNIEHASFEIAFISPSPPYCEPVLTYFMKDNYFSPLQGYVYFRPYLIITGLSHPCTVLIYHKIWLILLLLYRP